MPSVLILSSTRSSSSEQPLFPHGSAPAGPRTGGRGRSPGRADEGRGTASCNLESSTIEHLLHAREQSATPVIQLQVQEAAAKPPRWAKCATPSIAPS